MELVRTAYLYGLFDNVKPDQNLRVASLGGGPGFELLAFREFFKLKKIGPKRIDLISADLEKTWGSMSGYLDSILYSTTSKV